MSSGPEDTGGEDMVGRSFTRSRRLPGMVGRLPGSAKPLIGGPYTLPQAGVMAAVIAVMAFNPQVWARFGLVPNLVILLAVPIGAGLLVRRMQGEGRSPWAVVSGAAGLLGSPRAGWLRGRPVRRPREVSTGGVLTLNVLDCQGSREAEQQHAASSGSGAAAGDVAQPAAGEPGVQEGPVLSPVQAALARRRREAGRQ
ncbi:hypothetical protein ACFC1B_06745 [Streptomyces xiamenensis]|uniref:hypothetical protein n=1 Tax=Streptomyces xiamenensis TaxID=408015 RepID=UPI0035DF5725